jgi:hypothetical protein
MLDMMMVMMKTMMMAAGMMVIMGTSQIIIVINLGNLCNNKQSKTHIITTFILFNNMLSANSMWGNRSDST